ncbi:MAG: hypothetical protein K9H49_09205 [Bacteroidales bacterium]|nr:hypothetical protein [Bacteroidales bacterium]MCF8391823.1 hypothetical protein [Bacteroidales bacterium]
MKFIKNNTTTLLFSLLILAVIGFSSCSQDDEVEVVLKTTEEYKADLSAIISIEKPKVENVQVGYDKGNFKDSLYYFDYKFEYMFALISAEAVLAKTDLTIADIVLANNSLASPGKKFNDMLWISDRRPIHELIVYCDTLRVHTPEGTEPGMVPAEPRNQFIAAISKAKSVRGSSATIDRQVAAAVIELNGELELFEEAIIK